MAIDFVIVAYLATGATWTIVKVIRDAKSLINTHEVGALRYSLGDSFSSLIIATLVAFAVGLGSLFWPIKLIGKRSR